MIGWLRRRKRRKVEETPGRLTLRLGGVELVYQFPNEAEMNAFHAGFREGMEQEVFALQRAGRLPGDWFVDFGQVKRTGAGDAGNHDRGKVGADR